jgi:hypothetical protein
VALPPDLTVHQVAAELGVNVSSVYRLIRDRIGRPKKLSKVCQISARRCSFYCRPAVNFVTLYNKQSCINPKTQE